MDIYTFLTREHRRLAELFNQVVDTTDIPLRRAVYEQIKSELTRYMQIKEATFYKALSSLPVSEKRDPDHGLMAHDEIRRYFDLIGDTSMSSEAWIERFGELKHAFAHMVAVEERVVFSEAKHALPLDMAIDLAELATRLKMQASSEVQAQ